MISQKPIGKGASCVVYKAFDKARDSMVAIKVVSLQKLNPQSSEEMKREIELLQNLKKEDCIIDLYDHEVWIISSIYAVLLQIYSITTCHIVLFTLSATLEWLVIIL